MPPEQQNPNEVELDAIAQLEKEGNDTLASIDQNTEAGAVASMKTTEAVKDLEAPLEAIALNTRPKDVQKMEIVQPEGDENALAKTFWQMLRGPKGEKGDKGDQGEKGDKGEPGADSSVPGPQGPQGERGEQGKPGRDGKNGKDGKAGRDGADGKDGKDGRDGKDAKAPSLTPIVKKLRDFIEEKLGEGLVQLRNHVASKTYSISELEGMEGATTGQVPTKQADGSWAPRTPSGSGGGGSLAVETPTGTVNDSNTSFAVENEPAYIVINGMMYVEGTGLYTSYSAGTITLSSPVGTGGFIRSFYNA